MEMADAIAITKADGPNTIAADGAKVLYQNALHLFPLPPSGWKPEVLTCSAHENRGIRELWEKITGYVGFTGKTGYFDERRKQQAVIRMHDTVMEYLNNSFYNNEGVKAMRSGLEEQLYRGRITSYKAALTLIDKYLKK
jgi:LAO/AO transport system kinase